MADDLKGVISQVSTIATAVGAIDVNVVTADLKVYLDAELKRLHDALDKLKISLFAKIVREAVRIKNLIGVGRREARDGIKEVLRNISRVMDKVDKIDAATMRTMLEQIRNAVAPGGKPLPGPPGSQISKDAQRVATLMTNLNDAMSKVEELFKKSEEVEVKGDTQQKETTKEIKHTTNSAVEKLSQVAVKQEIIRQEAMKQGEDVSKDLDDIIDKVGMITTNQKEILEILKERIKLRRGKEESRERGVLKPGDED